MKTTSDRLKEYMQETGLRQVDIVEKCKPYCEKYNVRLGKSDVSQYVSGKIQPGQRKLTILGMALNVSETWLMGLDVPQKRIAAPDGSGNQADPIDLEIAKLILSLTADQKKEVLHYLQFLLSKNR